MNSPSGNVLFILPGYVKSATGGFLLNKQDLESLVKLNYHVDYVGFSNVVDGVEVRVKKIIDRPKILSKLLALIFLNGEPVFFEIFKEIYKKRNQCQYLFQEGTRSWVYVFFAKILRYKVLVRAHNIEADYYKSVYLNSRVENLKGLLVRIKHKIKYYLILIGEKVGVSIADGVVVLTAKDKNWFLSKNNNVFISSYFSKKPQKKRRHRFRKDQGIKVIFVGSLGFWPNRKAHDVVLEIAEYASTRFEFHFYGNVGSVETSRQNNIVYHGFCDDISEAYNDADIFCCPINHGAGMKIKVSESLSYGVPVILTEHSYHGYEKAPAVSILGSKRDFEKLSLSVLKDLYDQTAVQSEYFKWIEANDNLKALDYALLSV